MGRRAKGQKVESNKQRKRNEGAGQRQLALGSLDGAGRRGDRQGKAGKGDQGCHGHGRWYCLQCPPPKTTEEEGLAMSIIPALGRQIGSTF